MPLNIEFKPGELLVIDGKTVIKIDSYRRVRITVSSVDGQIHHRVKRLPVGWRPATQEAKS